MAASGSRDPSHVEGGAGQAEAQGDARRIQEITTTLQGSAPTFTYAETVELPKLITELTPPQAKAIGERGGAE